MKSALAASAAAELLSPLLLQVIQKKRAEKPEQRQASREAALR